MTAVSNQIECTVIPKQSGVETVFWDIDSQCGVIQEHRVSAAVCYLYLTEGMLSFN